jgi:DNA-binding NarL/FixJ family response regulator
MLSSIRILLVDDFEYWLGEVRLLLQPRPEWQVIAEASDGLEAVRKAEALKPDLILLDIGLPKVNGIEAAQRIRQLSPSSQIIFLSQNNNLDIVRAAVGTGPLGYVLKTDAERELLPAVDAVLRGEQFISSSNGFKFTEDLKGQSVSRRQCSIVRHDFRGHHPLI